MKRHLFRRGNGQFRRGTLRDLGVRDSELSDGALKRCSGCGEESRPIMKSWVCQCGQRNEQSEAAE